MCRIKINFILLPYYLPFFKRVINRKRPILRIKPKPPPLIGGGLTFFYSSLLYIDVFFFFFLKKKVDMSVLICVCNVKPAKNSGMPMKWGLSMLFTYGQVMSDLIFKGFPLARVGNGLLP